MTNAENHILIVDDEPVIRKTLVSNFEEKNWIVHTANDGMQAIRSVRAFCPDIVLMDIIMPGRDGITTCSIIRKDITLNPDIPIIMMTGSHDKNQIMKGALQSCR